MTVRAALLAAVLLSAGCSLESNGDDQPRNTRYLVYTKQIGLRAESVWIGDVDGRRMRRLVRGYGGLVSPDGRTVAFHRGEAPSTVYVVEPEGGDPRRVDGITQAQQWFPDSRHLLASGAGGLIRVDTDGEGTDVLVENADLVRGWSVAPDGRLAYAQARRDEPWGLCREDVDVYVVGADGRGRRRLTTDGRSSDPVWVTGGIVYARHPVRPGCTSPAAGIASMRQDGRSRRDIVFPAPARFASNGYYGLRPYGLVRGRQILLAGVRTEWGNELVLVDTRNGRISRPDLDRRPRRIRPMYVGYVSTDGRHAVGTACGAEFPCSINVYSVLEGRGRTLASGRVAGAHWNR